MLAQGEVAPASDLARKRDKPYLIIEPEDHLEDAEVATSAKI